MNKISVHYRMVLTIMPFLFYSFAPFPILRRYLCTSLFSGLSKGLHLSNHLYGQEARKVFIQHPRFNIEVFLKRTKDGWSIIHRHWPKVAKIFNINEGSIFAFCFSIFQMRFICPCTVYDANFERL